MKSADITDVMGFIVGAEIVQDDTYGVMPLYETTQPTEDEEAPAEHALTGYRIAVPVPPGLYKPRFDMEAWDAYLAKKAAYEAALLDWYAKPEEERGEPPANDSGDPSASWIEGLTPEELTAIQNLPKLETDADKIVRLEAEKSALSTRLEATEGAIVSLMDTLLMLNAKGGGV